MTAIRTTEVGPTLMPFIYEMLCGKKCLKTCVIFMMCFRLWNVNYQYGGHAKSYVAFRLMKIRPTV
jgi:hypothetical protein